MLHAFARPLDARTDRMHTTRDRAAVFIMDGPRPLVRRSAGVVWGRCLNNHREDSLKKTMGAERLWKQSLTLLGLPESHLDYRRSLITGQRVLCTPAHIEQASKPTTGQRVCEGPPSQSGVHSDRYARLGVVSSLPH